MSMTCETVRVQMDKSADNPTGVVIINASDVTPEHKVIKDAAEETVAPEPVKEPEAPAPEPVKAPEPVVTTVPAGATPAPWAKP